MAIENELQNEVVDEQEPEEQEETTLETPETGDTESESVEHKPLPDKVQKVINRKHFQYHEERRKREALEARIQELESKQQTTTKPEVPEVPDTYDVDYAAKMTARDAAIKSQAQWEANKQTQTTQTEQQVQTRQDDRAKQIQERDAAFSQKAVTLGIKVEDSVLHQQAIAPFVSPDLALYLLDDPNGPLIVKHLASDAMELEKIMSMSPIQAAIYIDKTITSKLPKTKKNIISGTPDPLETVSGGAGAATQSQDKFMKGVTLE